MNLADKTILVTAGPTYEPVDAVRFIGNYSSGKMGFALAEALASKGAQVILISGPTSLSTQNPRISTYNVRTALEMLEKCLQFFPSSDGAILSAAVADYRPVSPVSHKIKRKDKKITIELEANPDIAATLGQMKTEKQFLAGFALETDNAKANAIEKLKKKNFDFIVLNTLEDKGSGFNSDTNMVTIISKDNNIIPFELKSKSDVALDIVNYLENLLN